MSIELMTKAFKARVGNQARKLILIKIADNADDSGCCFPSYQAIAHACEVDRSTVIRQVKAMQKLGILTVKKRFIDGENSSNIFTINIKKLDEMGSGTYTPPSGTEPLPQSHTATTLVAQNNHPSSTEPLPLVAQRHPESSIFNHQLTIIEPERESASATPIPSVKPVKPKTSTPNPNVSEKPETVSDELWAEWLGIRKAKKQPVPTPRAVQSITEEAGKVGLTIAQAITECCDRGWATFKAAWYENSQTSMGVSRQQTTGKWNNISHGIDYHAGLGPNGEILV
jgi:hypothetical protein